MTERARQGGNPLPLGDADFALIGTGVAPLAAAAHLMSQGKSVLLLNPDLDFFLEDSEFPIDPIWPVSPVKDAGSLNVQRTPGRLKRSSPEAVLEALRPDFPGAVEFWSPTQTRTGFHDPQAPHVRSRSRLWLTSTERDRDWPWELMESLYLEASEAGLHPQILEGLPAAMKFPGFSKPVGDYRGLLLPRICDVDVTRYRNGLLEFVRERLGDGQLACGASQVEIMPEGLRYHSRGTARTARVREGVLAFWTPRMTGWILAQAKRFETKPVVPAGVRLWERWSLVSRDALDPGVIGVFRDMAVWAEVEGEPSVNQPLHQLSVLRAGPRLGESGGESGGDSAWASRDSFEAVRGLCHGLLKWEGFSVRAMRPHAVMEWSRKEPWSIAAGDLKMQVVGGCDGALPDVVRAARAACARLGAA